MPFCFPTFPQQPFTPSPRPQSTVVFCMIYITLYLSKNQLKKLKYWRSFKTPIETLYQKYNSHDFLFILVKISFFLSWCDNNGEEMKVNLLAGLKRGEGATTPPPWAYIFVSVVPFFLSFFYFFLLSFDPFYWVLILLFEICS